MLLRVPFDWYLEKWHLILIKIGRRSSCSPSFEDPSDTLLLLNSSTLRLLCMHTRFSSVSFSRSNATCLHLWMNERMIEQTYKYIQMVSLKASLHGDWSSYAIHSVYPCSWILRGRRSCCTLLRRVSLIRFCLVRIGLTFSHALLELWKRGTHRYRYTIGNGEHRT